jgi:raffinose/stachyose/melibiose transport system substrate-binding protein
MSKRSMFLLVVLVLTSLIVASCGPSAAPTGEPVAEESAAVESAGEEPITIYWLDFLTEGEPKQRWQMEVYDEFKKAHPNVEIEFIWAGRDNLTKLQPMIAAGQTPTVISGDPELPWRLEGELWSFDEALETNAWGSDEKWKDTFLDALWSGLTFDGQVVGIPHNPYIMGVFYDKKQFADLGVTPPATWDELLATCEKIEAQGVSCLGLDNLEIDYNSWWWYWLAQRLIGTDDAYRVLTTANEPFDDAGWLQATQMVEELIDEGYFQDGFQGSAWPAAQMLQMQGQVAMMYMGAWLPGEMLDSTPEGFEFDMFRFPSVEGGKGDQTAVSVWSNTWVIHKDGPYKEYAVDYIKIATSKEFQALEVEKYQQPSPLKGLPAPTGLESLPTILADCKEPTLQYLGLRLKDPELFVQHYRPVIDQLFAGDLRGETFLEEMAKARDNYYAGQ